MSVDLAGPLDGEFRWILRLAEHRDDPEMAFSEFTDVIERVTDDGGGPVQVWVPDIDDATHRFVSSQGFIGYRDLWQLRVPLPVPGARSPLEVSTFDPEQDLDEFIEVNRRAFEWHPEQGRLTAADIMRSMDEPWFSSDGFLIHRVERRIAAFCWTKIHRDVKPHLGEIYVIAVDPDFHGRGLGEPMTRAGLDHLTDQGLTTAMLYVEADNTAANRVYHRLGFIRDHIDRAYRGGL